MRGPTGSERCQSWSTTPAHGGPGSAWVLGLSAGGAEPSFSSLGLVKVEELPLTFSSGFLATLVQLCISNEASPTGGSGGDLGRWSRHFGDSLPLLLLASSPLTLHICSSLSLLTAQMTGGDGEGSVISCQSLWPEISPAHPG